MMKKKTLKSQLESNQQQGNLLEVNLLVEELTGSKQQQGNLSVEEFTGNKQQQDNLLEEELTGSKQVNQLTSNNQYQDNRQEEDYRSLQMRRETSYWIA